MSAFSFQSNYQIHLNLIISQTLGWDLYIIRAICLSQTASFLTQLLWKKVPSLLNSLHTSPVHWVIKIVLSFAESLSCHLSRFFLLFQPCLHCCTNFTFHPLTTSCMNGLDLINVVFRQHVNCSVDLISAFSRNYWIRKLALSTNRTFFLFIIPNSWNVCPGLIACWFLPPSRHFAGNTHQPSCHTFLSPQCTSIVLETTTVLLYSGFLFSWKLPKRHLVRGIGKPPSWISLGESQLSTQLKL